MKWDTTDCNIGLVSMMRRSCAGPLFFPHRDMTDRRWRQMLLPWPFSSRAGCLQCTFSDKDGRQILCITHRQCIRLRYGSEPVIEQRARHYGDIKSSIAQPAM